MTSAAYAATSAEGVPNGGVSFWYRQIGAPAPRGPLPGDLDADVCIVGGGLTGLWTAYYLKQAQPDLDVVVLEREFCGYGASGRNGGWLSAEIAAPARTYLGAHGEAGVRDLHAQMRTAVDEVLRVLEHEGVDADVQRDGILHVARSRAQLDRLGALVDDERRWGAEVTRLTADETTARIAVSGALGGAHVAGAARVQPAKLVQGVAAAAERSGVRLFERTTVTSVRPGAAETDHGTVRARFVLRCLEGFSAGLPGQRRTWLPMNSAMVVTAPLPDAVRARIGWHGAELLGDLAHAYVYAQRTEDGRIAFGGRGIPYRYGSRTDVHGRTQPATVRALVRLLHEFFPAAAAVPVEHAWCGVLGVPRDWSPTVHVDRGTGLGWAGGYVGSGLTTTNLAGRTLRDLVLGSDTALTRLPWTGRQVRRWEPEPLRWLGVHALYALYREADRRETRGLARTSLLARAATRVAGR
ncbi:MAG: FAD-dependent oxidoreductase [Blastococcus sp.]|nr:FAD-dependent oxidoreductase [Blastococcus sp.]